jgi:hypothetical protein
VQRREFITLLAGAALIGPSTAIAQTPKVYRLGSKALSLEIPARLLSFVDEVIE